MCVSSRACCRHAWHMTGSAEVDVAFLNWPSVPGDFLLGRWRTRVQGVQGGSVPRCQVWLEIRDDWEGRNTEHVCMHSHKHAHTHHTHAHTHTHRPSPLQLSAFWETICLLLCHGWKFQTSFSCVLIGCDHILLPLWGPRSPSQPESQSSSHLISQLPSSAAFRGLLDSERLIFDQRDGPRRLGQLCEIHLSCPSSICHSVWIWEDRQHSTPPNASTPLSLHLLTGW